MNEEHEPGRCYACRQETQVRWKNIYTIGSEGTYLCLPCELKVVRLLEGLSREAMDRQKKEYIRKRQEREHTASIVMLKSRVGQESWWIPND